MLLRIYCQIEVKKAINENILYPHDLDFYATGTTTCSQIPLAQMLANGFHTGHGHMRQPQDIKSALALSSIIFKRIKICSMVVNRLQSLILI